MTAATCPLRPGDPAPDFLLRDQHGVAVNLRELRGRDVLIVFYPFAFSGVCTGEMQALREGWPDLAATGSALVAVSCDPIYALRTYAERELLDFPLVSDFWPHGEVSRAFGVLDTSIGAPHRSTFLVDKGGVIGWSVHVARHESRSVEDYRVALGAVAKPDSGAERTPPR